MGNDDVRVPPWFAIKRLGVTKQTFNYWRVSGKLTPDGNGEYRWGDVVQVERETRLSANSRRGIPQRRWADLGMQRAG